MCLTALAGILYRNNTVLIFLYACSGFDGYVSELHLESILVLNIWLKITMFCI